MRVKNLSNNRILVYRSSLLAYSETFIAQQVASLKRWQPILVGSRRLLDGLNVEGVASTLITDNYNTFWQKIERRLFRDFGWPKSQEFRDVEAYQPALVHVHFGTDAVAAWSWVKHLGVPMLVTLHGFDINISPDWWTSGRGGDYRCNYPKRLKKLAQEKNVSFIAVSQAIRQQAIEVYDIPAEKIAVLHIGVDHQAFSPGKTPIYQRPLRVLFVGRLVEKKAASILIRAMEIVQRQLAKAELTIVGDGPQRVELEQLANKLKVDVNFLGEATNTAVRENLHEARIFCLPSITASNGDAEGLPIVLLEAQACGLPVVTSARGGRDEGIAEGVTGFSFPEGDVAALASHLLRLLQDDNLVQKMSEAGPSFIAKNFRLDVCTNSLEAHYDSQLELK
jgi:colanic acid/amylovoran biosynthesis glycosyltransferase